MLIEFFLTVKQHRIPVSIREFLDLINGLKNHLAFASWDDFYALARVCLVKDERYFDKFDRAFKAYFDGLESLPLDELFDSELPEDWLRKQLERHLSEEEKAQLEALGDLDELMKAFQERLAEQHKRHQGGNRMIGTGGTSPFGAYGFNPAGFRMAGAGRHKRAVKVWEKRQFANLDDELIIGTRNWQMALRRLRKMARTGPADQLDLPDTIDATAKQAGWLDIRFKPERRNAVKLLLFFDVGGSMDPYVQQCEELFSAARSEFKYLEYFYFHNCLYESVWPDNNRRNAERVMTWDLLHRFGEDYRIIFVGDACMSPYELTSVGGSIEHWNQEPGALWLQRIKNHFRKVIWLNPQQQSSWAYTPTIDGIQKIMEQKMFPLTLKGVEEAITELT